MMQRGLLYTPRCLILSTLPVLTRATKRKSRQPWQRRELALATMNDMQLYRRKQALCFTHW